MPEALPGFIAVAVVAALVTAALVSWPLLRQGGAPVTAVIVALAVPFGALFLYLASSNYSWKEPATRQEPGCEQYDLFRAGSQDRPTFHLIERYANGEALEAHRATDHYRAYRAEIPDLLDEPIGVLVLTEVG